MTTSISVTTTTIIYLARLFIAIIAAIIERITNKVFSILI